MGSNPHSCMTHHEGVMPLTPNILFNNAQRPFLMRTVHLFALSPVVRTACTKSNGYPSCLPIGFPGTCLLTFLKMLSAVWLVSDFASTPFALKLQFGILSLPLLAIYVRLMIMSRMKSMFSFTARTLRWFLSAESTGSSFHRQDRMCLLLYTRKTILMVWPFLWLSA
jgi:hypothetical protein